MNKAINMKGKVFFIIGNQLIIMKKTRSMNITVSGLKFGKEQDISIV